jgi:DJ-1/PfpI family
MTVGFQSAFLVAVGIAALGLRMTPTRGRDMEKGTAHLAAYDTLTDSEVGHLLVELHTGRFSGTSFEVVTVAESRAPITTMGGVRVLPDSLLADLEPADSDLLILTGGEMWDAGGGQAFAAAAGRFLDAEVPVGGHLRRHSGPRAGWAARRSQPHERLR